MLPVIKVWCLPKISQSELEKIFTGIVKVVESISELHLIGGKSMLILFPVDAMEYGLGTEIFIEVSGLIKRPERTEIVRNRLAYSLGILLKGFFPNARVKSYVHPFKKLKFWISKPGEIGERTSNEINLFDGVYDPTKDEELLKIASQGQNRPTD